MPSATLKFGDSETHIEGTADEVERIGAALSGSGVVSIVGPGLNIDRPATAQQIAKIVAILWQVP